MGMIAGSSRRPVVFLPEGRCGQAAETPRSGTGRREPQSSQAQPAACRQPCPGARHDGTTRCLPFASRRQKLMPS